jgi:phosphoglycerate dehydrogenase-like enzyme
MRRIVVNMRDARPVWSIPEWAIDEIRRAAAPRFEVVVVDSFADGRGDGGPAGAEAIEAIGGAEIHLGYGFPKPLFEAAMSAGGALRWVHSGSAGVGGALYPEMRASTVHLTNSAGIHAEPMADSVLAMLLYFARGLDFAVQGQREATWNKDPFDATDTPMRELRDSTLGIVGYGGIGRAVAKRAVPLGMRVLAYRRTEAAPEPGVEQLRGDGGLAELLAKSHYVLLSLPRTASTEGLLGRERIASLRGDSVVINVGRGELIDEAALAAALGEGRIRGAALDVFVREPLSPESPLWRLPNVLVTPHVSATSHRFWRRELDLILENLGRYLRGEPLLNSVDKTAGY